MKEIYLVRHGETDWNNLGLAQGSANDIPLNKTGMEQAKYTGKYLNEYQQNETNFDLVLCSPMLRTVKTAENICKQIKYDINKIKYMDELIERDQGFLSIGKTDKEMKKDKFYDDYFNGKKDIADIEDPIEKYKARNDLQNNVICPKYGYETDKKFHKKIKVVISLLKKTKAKKILIITHGGTILHGFIRILFNIDNIIGDYKYGANCHITYITYNNKKFNLAIVPNTLHFGLYNKNYSEHYTIFTE
jgi:broad specificity phosphatase PhoE